MRVGTEYLYVEANDEEVIIYSKSVKILGQNRINKKLIPYSEITSVGFTNNGGLAPTYTLTINFKGAEKPQRVVFSCLYVKSNDVESLKEYIETQIKKIRGTKHMSAPKSKAGTLTAELFKLKDLLDNDLITPDEFHAMKEQLFSSDSPNDIEAPNSSEVYKTGMLTVEDFIIDTGKEKFNFITDDRWDYYEFCETDVTYTAARGVTIKSTYEEICDIFSDLNAYMDNQYDYSKDSLYKCFREGKSDLSEIEVLKKCNKSIKFVLETKINDNIYNISVINKYSITFYFDNINKLRLIGYLKERRFII